MSRNFVLLWKHPKKKPDYQLAQYCYGNLMRLIHSEEFQNGGPKKHRIKSYWIIYSQLRKTGQYEDEYCIIKRCDVVKTEKKRRGK